VKVKVFMSLSGSTREWNTDHVIQASIYGSPLYIVCDGVQQQPECGELVRAFCREVCSQNLSLKGEVTDIEQNLRDGFARAAANLKGKYRGDYSFCVAAALIHGGRLYTIHAGDCRVGKVGDQGIKWLTIDHVPAFQRLKTGELTETEYAEQRNKVAGWVKITDTGSLEVNSFEYAGERLLLCSDGFWAYADEKWLLGTESTEDKLKLEINRIEKQGHDNLSVILISSE
jgi:serine/threonine protein phosphatase PrpC